MALLDIQKSLTEMNGKLAEQGAKIDRLVADTGAHGTKIDDLRHQASFTKGAVAACTIFVTGVVGVATFFLSTKWDAAVQALAAFKQASH